jgi:hypothetical protein
LRGFVAVFLAARGFFRAVASVIFPLAAAPIGDGQFQLGLFRRAMVAMVQRLDARSFFVLLGLVVFRCVFEFVGRPLMMTSS